MTKAAYCAWCGGELPKRSGPGRPRVYCSHSCRQQAHVARKLARAADLDPGFVAVERRRLSELQGLLIELQAAVEDVEADLEDPDVDVHEALRWLMRAAKPLADAWIPLPG